jgi:RHS repeat-associated protein
VADDAKPSSTTDDAKLIAQADTKPTAQQSDAEPTRALPSPTLPKGGGAIRDLGEKFSANPATGAGSLTVPIFTSPGRSGFGPTLTLQYDTATGNGPFGIGWALGVPHITRKTDKGLPCYRDYEDSDTFILSGSEDLVPLLLPNGSNGWTRDERPAVENGQSFTVRRYRPRVEALYARIERWTRSDGDAHWRAITKDNVASVYGRSPTARIADPDDAGRVFSWLLEETRDGKGNVVAYKYKAEDQKNLDPAVGFERPRGVANAYLARIFYGNHSPGAPADWHLQVLFDYGEYDVSDPLRKPPQPWPARPDPFSDFRPTFELRTYRLCRRVLMLHRFDELASDWRVVRSTELTYEPNPIATYLRSVTQKGWISQPNGSYAPPLALPAIDVDYSRPVIDPTVRDADPETLVNLPVGIDGRDYQLLDLDGEGVAGVLTAQAGALYYKRSEGDGRFGALERIGRTPGRVELRDGSQQVVDLDGSGEKFIVQLGTDPQGFFARTDDGWTSFRPFRSLPNLDWRDPALRHLDLDGDGLPDVMKPDGERFRWWPSLGRDGYGAESQALVPRDDDSGPYVVWSDARQAILVADMNGDGLADLVRVRDGSVDYWPNLGYGRFGKKVTMRDAPWLAAADRFNPAQVRLADVDGSGTADLLYLDDEGARIWMNEAGNGFGPMQRVALPSPAGATVEVLDLLGKGTACLVWSSPLPRAAGRQLRYVDLMSGGKPHLLTSLDNHLGTQTTIEYRPSTEFYLADREAGLPWITKLPFPTQVVARVETREAVTGTRLVSTYRYHHGHYDGIEREFAGFGMVEEEDAETVVSGAAPPERYTPPRRTRNWFHTGAYFDAETVSTQYAHEYSADLGQLLVDSVLPPEAIPAEAREAARALRGHLLRQEVYGLDGTAAEPHPYVVAESNFTIRRLQPKADNRYAAFCVHPRETLTAHTERMPSDARIEHELTLAVDDFGNVTKAAHVAYGRATGEAAQQRTLATYVERDYVTLTNGTGYYRADLLRESRTYELVALPAQSAPFPFGVFGDLVGKINGPPTSEIDFADESVPAQPARRLIERTRHRFAGDQPADDALLALGLEVETQRATLTPLLVDDVYQGLVTDANARRQLLLDNRYVDDGGLWWSSAGVTEYDAASFQQARRFTDPFGGVSTVDYDGYSLLIAAATTGVGTPYQSAVSALSDYRVLAATEVTDANENRTQATFDALGRVTATIVMGKAGQNEGDDLAHPTTRLEYHLDVVPAFVYVERREQHWLPARDPASNQRLQRAYTYSDGLGRDVLTKKQAEPGSDGKPRWVGSGRTIFDNKGNPVRKYEPYFSATPAYENLIKGVSDTLHYDPVSRLVRTDHPNGSYSRVEPGAWVQIAYDENDTVAEPGNAWYARMSTGTPDEQDAATKTLAHAHTPTTTYGDALGRTVITDQHAGFRADGSAILLRTAVELDIQGNPRAVTDARGLAVATHRFDMLGRRLAESSVDAGDSARLVDALGAIARQWTANGIAIEREHDALRRPTRVWVTEGGQRRLAERSFWGETLADAAARNLRGRIFRQLDGAGLLTHERYDFHGNLARASRQLAVDYAQQPSWPDIAEPTDATTPPPIPALDAEAFVTSTVYDALDRLANVAVPSGTASGDHVAVPTYNEAGLLETVAVTFAGDGAPTPFVNDVDYNEKGQREQIVYGNGVVTTYGYEKDTFRLSSLKTARGGDDVQDLAYTYDAVGNVTRIGDAAQDTLFFANQVVLPASAYTYDPIYRLTIAEGREHGGQAVPDQSAAVVKGAPLPNPNDVQNMRRYTQRYDYDAVGNFLSIVHQAFQGPTPVGWTRTYDTDPASNRLRATTVGGVTAKNGHDAAGNMRSMESPFLPTVDWSYRNEMVHAARGGGGDVYFAYDAGGERVRKVLVDGSSVKERVYLGAYEVYRERSATGTIALERRTLHVHDDKRRVALVELRTKGNDGSPARLIRYQLDNHLGSAVVELDQAAALLSYEEYHPFGTTAYRATASVLDKNPKRYAFIGNERDEETGLYYIGARYYACWLGRWTATDPQPSLATSRYVYANDRPTVLVDTDGRKPSHPDRNIFIRGFNAVVDFAASQLGTTHQKIVRELIRQENENREGAKNARLVQGMEQFAEQQRQAQAESKRAEDLNQQLRAQPGAPEPSENKLPGADVHRQLRGQWDETSKTGNLKLFKDVVGDGAHEAGIWIVFGGLGTVGKEFEGRVLAKVGSRSERILARNEREVAELLGVSKKEAGRLSDFITKTGSKFNLIEAKGAEIGSEGSKIDEAVAQLTNTAKHFSNAFPNAKIGRVEIAIPHEVDIAERGSQYAVRGNHVVNAATGEVLTLLGKAVTAKRY